MTDWAKIQAEAFSTASKKAKALSETIINSKLSRRELEDISFIIQLEITKRKERKELKKIIDLEEYKEQHQAQGPGSEAPPEGPGNQAQGPGSANND